MKAIIQQTIGSLTNIADLRNWILCFDCFMYQKFRKVNEGQKVCYLVIIPPNMEIQGGSAQPAISLVQQEASKLIGKIISY